MTLTCTPHPQGQQIAQTIRSQIGRDAWLAVSARDPRWWTNSTGDVVFAFRFGSRYGLPRWIEITYQQVSDDYDLIAYRIHRNGCKRTIDEYDGLYCDALAPMIRAINLDEEMR